MTESFKENIENKDASFGKWQSWLESNGGQDGLKHKLVENYEYTEINADKLLHNLGTYAAENEKAMVKKILEDLKEQDKANIIVGIDEFLD